MVNGVDGYMDKQTAAELLDNLIGMVEDTQENDYDTALKMGIEALKAHAQPETDLTTNIENVLSLLNEINSSGRMDYGDYCALYDAIEVLLPI